MLEISNKKRKFIKRNFKQLSIEELAHKTGLKPKVIKSLIDQYSAEMPGKDQSAQENGAGIFPSWKTILLTSLLFAVTTFIIYSPSLHGDFVFDDSVIQENPLIHITKLSQLLDLMFSKEISRRIGLMNFALNYYFGGLNPSGYHLVNVIIHILNGLILFLISYTILTLPLSEGKKRENVFKISFLGSLLWLVHPIQTQAVSYIVQRLTSLSTLFFLLSLLCYIKGRLHLAYKRGALFICSIIFGLLALGTKQNAATLPFFIILSESFFFQPHPFKIDKKKLGLIIIFGGLLILISGIYLGPDFISKIALQYQERGWTPLERVLTQLRVVILYISLLIYPHPSRLNLDYDFPISHSLFYPFTTFLSLLVIICSLALAIFMVRRNRLVSYAIFWFFGNLVIESSIIPLELVFEHRLYLPSIALIMLIPGLCVSLPKREWEKWTTALIIPFILLFSYWTYERASVWREPLSLWMDAVKKSPNKARPHNNLGLAYDNKAMLDEAISEYKKVLTINPNLAGVHTNLGLVYAKKGRLDEAIDEHKKAITIKPNYAEAHTNLGSAYFRKRRLDEAIAEHKKALTINPNLAGVHTNLGLVYAKKGRLDEAIAEYKKTLAIKPNLAEAYYSLGNAYAKKGRLDEAISEYKKALTIKPNLAEAYYSLGNAYAKKGRFDEAISQYKKTLAIKPNFTEAYYKVGSLLKIQGKLREAISTYREAIRLKPDCTPAYNDLAWIYATSPDATIRNGGEAVILATKACELTGFKNKEALDTLAASYAEQGDFKKALEYQNRAVELALPQIKRELQKRLHLYKLRQPYRDQ